MVPYTGRVDQSTLHTLLSAEGVKAVLRRTVGAVSRRVEADRVVLAFERAGTLEAVQIAGGSDEWPRRWADPFDHRLVAFRSGEPQLIDDSSDCRGVQENGDPAKSLLCVPVEEYGVLFAEAAEPSAFTEDDWAWLEEMATYLQAALDRFDAPVAESTTDDEAGAGGGSQFDRLDDRFQFVLDATDSILWEHDLETEGVTLFGPVERLLGNDGRTEYSESEFLDAFVHPDDVDRLSETLRAVALGEAEDIEIQYRIRAETGDEGRWLRARAAVDGSGGRRKLVGLSTDVTDHVTREQRIKHLQQRTTRLIGAQSKRDIINIAVNAAGEALTLSMSGVHLRNGDVLEAVAVNEPVWDAFEELPDYSANSDDPIAAFVWDTYESGRPAVVEDTADHGQLSEASNIRSAVVYPLDDHGVFIASSPEPNAFDSADVAFGEVIAMSVVAALDRAEQERRLKTQAEELEHKNERLEEFASIVSHDLRNPMNVALGRIEYVRNELDGDCEHLQTAEDALERMEAIIDETLLLARQGHTVAATEEVDVEGMVEQCWQNVATEDAALILDFQSSSEPTVQADGDRLAHVFENLFRNAIEHNDERVTIRVGPLGADSGFYVEDDGRGIPRSEREAVFEAGYTTGENGSGFGLSLVRDIVEAHGWTIDVETGPDGGARFEIATAE